MEEKSGENFTLIDDYSESVLLNARYLRAPILMLYIPAIPNMSQTIMNRIGPVVPDRSRYDSLWSDGR